MIYTRILGLVLVMGVLVKTMSLGGDLSYFFNIPSLVIVLGGSIAALIASYGSNAIGFFKAFSLRVIGVKGQFEDEIFDVMCRAFIQYAYLFGVFGVITGTISMLSNMDDPNAIGPAIAVALLTIFYAVILDVLVTIVRKRHVDSIEKTEFSLSRNALVVIILVSACINLFFIAQTF